MSTQRQRVVPAHNPFQLGDWAARADCRPGLPGSPSPDTFHPSKPQGGGKGRAWDEYRRDVMDAKAICAFCPVRLECLEYAVTADERHGIWGGLDEDEREALRKAAA